MLFNQNNYIVYLLINNINNRTYLGITNNPDRRIKQHNGILKGGAKYTHSFKQNGKWLYYLKIINLTKREALSLERTAKNKRKGAKGTSPIQKRINVLIPLLSNYPHANCIYHTQSNPD